MNQVVLYTIITLITTGVVAAVVLYLIAQKFKVYEDPKIDMVEEALPAANCGGCGYPGCRGFSEAIVMLTVWKVLLSCRRYDTMNEVASIMGLQSEEKEPEVAVVRCNGKPSERPRTNTYDGAKSCTVVNNLYIGESGCPNGLSWIWRMC